jgi:iron complex transport system substrate-binding protein
VTQAVCAVCAVSYDDVLAIAGRLPSRPRVVSQDPSTLGEVLADVRSLGRVAGADQRAGRLVRDLADRIDRVRAATDSRTDQRRPRVAALEWLDPPFVGGHWVPQMIELAGGEDALGLAGEKSRTVRWEEIEQSRPEVVVAMPCGYAAQRSAREAFEHREQLAPLGAHTIVAVDAAAFFSRPGPRLVEGIELLAWVLHPDLVEPPPAERVVSLHPESALAPR